MQAEREQKQAAGRPIRLVQITDTHLFEDPGGQLVGLTCEDSFREVLRLIRRQQQGIDGIVCTGDITQDASLAAYRRFHQALTEFGVPNHWIPGNHDLMENLRAALGDEQGSLEKSFALGPWRILMLDSSVRGEVHGRLAEPELRFLDRQLASCREPHVLICVHHNPLPVEAQWLQHHALQNPEDFFAVIDRYDTVRCVLWGHIHQEYERERRGVRMLASPSTCVQFHPQQDDFTIDRLNPGYRWLDLLPDGRIDTGVERTELSFDIDFSSIGY